jgi:hypothetical protein
MEDNSVLLNALAERRIHRNEQHARQRSFLRYSYIWLIISVHGNEEAKITETS